MRMLEDVNADHHEGPGRGDRTHGPQTGREHRRKVLSLAKSIGFVDATLVGESLWRNDPHKRKYAERLLARLVNDDALLRRPVAGRRGAYVLTKIGAAEIGGTSGARWGRLVKDGVAQRWLPPLTFDHDRRAARFGCWMERFGYRPFFEREYRDGKESRSVADVILVDVERSVGVWVEVENAQKNATERLEQIDAAIQRFRSPPSLSTPWGRVALKHTSWVLPPTDWRDIRGYFINHEPALRREWASVLNDHIEVVEDTAEFSRKGPDDIRAASLPLRAVHASVWREIDTGFEKLESLKWSP